MVMTTRVARSGRDVSAALHERSPLEAARFDQEYREALVRAAETFDLVEAETVLSRWWGIANLRVNPLTVEEQELVRRFRAGEDVGRASPTARI